MAVADGAGAEAHRELARAFFAAYEHGDLAALTACWAPEAINHGGLTAEAERRARAEGRLPSGLAGLRLVLTSLLTAFPDRTWHIEDMVVDQDKVVCRLTVSGTHQGVPQLPVEGGMLLKNLQPTGAAYSVQHIHIFRVAGGKIVEHWAVRDDLGLLQQLGALPDGARA